MGRTTGRRARWKAPVQADQVGELEILLGHTFSNRDWLERALTHRSAANERGLSSNADNEQLEFLGDSILSFVVSESLFRRFSQLTEGELSKIRAHLVSAANLFRIAGELNLGAFLRLGKGEEKTGGRKKQALLVDALEAVVAAVYLDAGIEKARRFVARCFENDFNAIESGSFFSMDFKSQLQERLQALRFPPAEYRIIRETGPDHQKHFSVELKVNGNKLTEGHGETKKSAEQEAARLALKCLSLQAT
ncbi:MAG: ribonuclease III [Acidobacteriota bacterium]